METGETINNDFKVGRLVTTIPNIKDLDNSATDLRAESITKSGRIVPSTDPGNPFPIKVEFKGKPMIDGVRKTYDIFAASELILLGNNFINNF